MEAISTPVAQIESEEFWQHHIQAQKMSGLSRINYSRQNDLNYNQFGYWIKKCIHNQVQSKQLIAVKVKTKNESVMQPTLCTLNLNSGHCLKIHDLKALAIIL